MLEPPTLKHDFSPVRHYILKQKELQTTKRSHIHSWKYFFTIASAPLSTSKNFTITEPIGPFPEAFPGKVSLS